MYSRSTGERMGRLLDEKFRDSLEPARSDHLAVPAQSEAAFKS
jgi:hypothetical protein